MTTMIDLHAGEDGQASEARLAQLTAHAISQPLVTHIYTADPSAHVFEGRLYIYPSHDIDGGQPFDDEGGHFGMQDYHVLKMDTPDSTAVDCGMALHVRDVPWARKQMWAPDAACRDGRYYLYFPAKDAEGRFRIGAAIGTRPEGPFVPQPEPIKGAYSIDPAVFEDEDGSHYLYFGGIWGGQLQKYRDNQYSEAHEEPEGSAPALGPRVGRLDACMTELAEPTREVQILDEHGQPLRADGDSPYGPFTYAGVILTPVVGWTTHHSICQFEGQWYLFYHDALMSGGITHLRSAKCTPLHMEPDGSIRTINPYGA